MDAVAHRGRLQLPDVRRPELTPSWPAWVASRLASLKGNCQPDAKGKYRDVLTLPANLSLTDDERAELIGHRVELEALCLPSAADVMLVKITELMFALPARQDNEISAEARGGAFMMALDDLPAWAVTSAIRRWYRGSCGEQYDYHWCPSPAELREIAMLELWRVWSLIEDAKRVLSAEPLIEYSEEHRATMCARFAGLRVKLQSSLVGTDGSSKAAGQQPAESATVGPGECASPA